MVSDFDFRGGKSRIVNILIYMKNTMVLLVKMHIACTRSKQNVFISLALGVVTWNNENVREVRECTGSTRMYGKYKNVRRTGVYGNVREVRECTENWSIREVKKTELQREKRVAFMLLHSLTRISSSAEYLVSLLSSKEAWVVTNTR